MNPHRIRNISTWATPIGLLVVWAGLSLPAFALEDVELTLVDANATGYGTFQSHNQRVVWNSNGIFVSYLHWYEDPDCTWRVDRSTDGGSSFKTIYSRDQHDTSHTPPALETDEEGNLYAAFADAMKDSFYVIRFLAGEEYVRPHETKIDYAPCAAKYAMVYDQPRQRFYIGLQYGGLITVGRDGSLLVPYRQVYSDGNLPGINSGPQYPHVHLDSEGTLYYAHTTADSHDVPFDRIYRSILCLRSPDGGETWQRMDGSPVTTPVRSDESGDATVVTEPEDLVRSTWLASTLTKGGRTHFWYARHGGEAPQPFAIPYVNYSTETGERVGQCDLTTVGTDLQLHGTDGFFATRDLTSDTCLYVIMADSGGRVAGLYSADNGNTWHDHARASAAHNPYAVSGSPRITPDGFILGAYTAKSGDNGESQIWFFKIRASAHEPTASE